MRLSASLSRNIMEATVGGLVDKVSYCLSPGAVMKDNQEYDIVIVGAGPAGCFVSKYLSKDYKVLLLDKSTFPRTKVCGGALLEKTTKFLDKLGLEIPEYVLARPKSMSIRYFDWDNDIKFEQKRNFLNVYRDKFDYWLLKESISNVDFYPETKLINFEKENDNLILYINKNGQINRIKSKYIVDASGVRSLTRKKTSNKIPRYVAVQYWIKSDHNMETLDFIICDEITDYYTWVIPKGEYLVIGSALKPSNARKKSRLFLDMVLERYNLPRNIHRKEAWLITRPSSIENIMLTADNVLLVGESAGLISSSTGEGISFALRSGYYCAQALNENFEEPSSRYSNSCLNLLEEVQEKIERAKIYENSSIRLKFFYKSSKKQN